MSALRPRSAAAMASPVRREPERMSWREAIGGIAVLLLWGFVFVFEVPLLLGGAVK